MQVTYFKDRRTGTVYSTTEKTLPVSGKIPLKPAYKSDTVWIDRDFLDTVKNPHELNGWRLFWWFALSLVVLALWVFTSAQLSGQWHIGMTEALVSQGGWTLVIWGIVLRHSGLSHA